MTMVLTMKPTPMLPFTAMLAMLLLSACCPLTPGPGGRAVPSEQVMPSPAVLPRVRPEMKVPGFWISRIRKPDRIVLGPDQVQGFNTRVREDLGLTRDPACMDDAFPGRELRADLNHWLARFRDRGPYFSDGGKPADPGFFEAIASNMALSSIGNQISVQWGLVTASTDQRLLPTMDGLYREDGDWDIDRLQNNGLNPGTPVAVLHRTTDRQWIWVKGPDSDGWVPAAHVALCPRQTLLDQAASPFATVTRAKASLYLDPGLTRYAGFARMGTRLMLAEAESPGTLAVLLPLKGLDGSLKMVRGYLREADGVAGFLTYTPRHVIDQAFELLNAPYGWGGRGGEQDCSQFVQQVFDTMGVHLPRNSAAQAEAGRDQLKFTGRMGAGERLAMLNAHALQGLSLLYMKGHIMLYLGTDGGEAYAIHSLWGYREAGYDGDTIRVLNRVAVTGLGLGGGSTRGSLLERLESVHGVYR